MQHHQKAGRPLAACLATAILCAAASPTAAGELLGYRHLVIDGHGMKWGGSLPGLGATVTYAVVTNRVGFQDAFNCKQIEPLTDMLRRSGLSARAFDVELTAAFDAWSAVADVTFRRATAANADILIGAQVRPRGRAYTNVSFAEPPHPERPGRLQKSAICLNPEKRWKIGFDGDLEVYDLRYVLTHEIGHAIGLGHPGTPEELMDFRYNEKFRAPQPGDVAGAIALYGPAPHLAAQWMGHDRSVSRSGDVQNPAESALSSEDATALP